MFQVGIDIASKTTKQVEDETEYYPRNEVDKNIRKQQSNNSDDKTPGQKEHEQSTATGSDVHQMTAHGDTGHR